MRLTLGNMLRLLLSLTISLSSPAALAQTADPSLNGIAIHSEFGKPQFIGALYSSSLSDKIEPLMSASVMRMELKILTPDGLTLRRFSRMWLEAMAINNDSALLTTEADNMLLFDSFFKDRLQQNDTIVFNYRQNKGVSINLNKVLLGSIDDDDFFAMLLRTWIGKVPLSTDYKNGILKAGMVTAELKSRFDSIQPSRARSKEIETWLNSKVVSSQKSSSAAAAKPQAVAAAASNLQAASSLQMASTLPTASDVKPAAEKSSSATATEEQAAAPAPSLESQLLLARQLYLSQLLKKIRANTRYPQRANDLGQSDSLRLEVVIDRQGKLLSTSFVQGSVYTLLNEAALDAIKKSAPLPQMPPLLTESTFEFSVPINFVAAGKK